jgi:hypothetical protein
MWLLERGYVIEPEKKNLGIRKWLTYITLFVAGLTLAGDLVTVLYYFIDGQELTPGFLLKILSVFVVILIVFLYYISDIRNKLNSKYRKIWLGISLVIILGSVVWGFSVLGSPRTQQLLKYDEQRVNDLQIINSDIQDYYRSLNALPAVLENLDGAPLNGSPRYGPLPVDPQTKQRYEYSNTSNENRTTYELCAIFNKASQGAAQSNIYLSPAGYESWTHSAGHYCFTETVTPNPIYKGVPTPTN